MQVNASDCMKCKNRFQNQKSCKAYEDIPDDIFFNKVRHTEPFGGEKTDNDGNPILFERKKNVSI